MDTIHVQIDVLVAENGTREGEKKRKSGARVKVVEARTRVMANMVVEGKLKVMRS